MNLNTIEITGRLTREPESEQIKTKKGETTSISKFTVACNGIDPEKTEYFPITFWGRIGDHAQSMLKKGMHVFIRGSITTSKKEDRTYIDVRGDQFLILESKKEKAVA